MSKRLILLMVLVCVLGSTTQAQQYIWNGSAGDGLWDAALNWTVADALWTWPNEEAVSDPNKTDRRINSGTVSIDILNGDAVTTARLAITGDPNGATTPVLTLDTGSSLTVGGRLSIGDSDNTNGQIDVLGGSTLIILSDDGDDLTVADNDGTMATLNIIDSTVEIADNLDSDQGHGNITIENSTINVGDDIQLAKNDNASDNTVVSGANTLITCDDLSIGRKGQSIFEITGGTIDVDDIQLSDDGDNGDSKMYISGADTVVRSADDLKLGDNGTALLEITGGTVYCKDFEIRAPGGGLVNLHGGTIIVNKNRINRIDDDNLLDIAGDGKLVLLGGASNRSNLDDFIADGKVTGNGVADPRVLSVVAVDGDLEVTYNANANLEIAYQPNPGEGSVEAKLQLTLEWTPGDSTVSHEVYFSEVFADVNDGTTPLLNVAPTVPSYIIGMGIPGDPYPDGLTPGTTYYWRVDEVAGTTTHRGDVWSFSVLTDKAHDLAPADGTVYVSTGTVLTWTPGLFAESHDVYISDTLADVNDGTVPTATVTDPEYAPVDLAMETTYYWRVDEFDGTTTVLGDVQSFSTPPVIAITDPNLLLWWKLDGTVPTVAIDQSGHDRHGAVEGATWVSNGQALDFGGDGDTVTTEDGDFLNGLSARTVCIWVKSNAINTDDGFVRFVDKGGDAANIRYDKAGADGGQANVLKYGMYTTENEDNREEDESSADAQTTDWQHVALTWESGVGLSLYLNGVLDTPSNDKPAQTGVTNGYDFVILGKGTKNGLSDPSGWNGLLDDLRIYDIALTVEEIQSIMTQSPRVENAGFESPDLGPGGTGQWADNADNWIINTQGNAYLEDGTWQIVSPEGVNALKVWGGGAIWQQVGNVSPDTDYEVSLYVGRGYDTADVKVQLWAGGDPAALPASFGIIGDTVGATLIGGASLTPTVEVGQSEWMSLILNTGTDFGSNDALWLRIESTGEAAWIDNVMVTVP